MYSYLIFVLIVSLVNANISYDSSNEDYNQVKNSRNFTGKVVLVTGSSAGIGAVTIKLFSSLGAQVVVTGRNAEEIRNVSIEAQELSPQKLKPLGVVADVTKSDDLSRLLNQTIKTFGKLDVLVNNAGIGLMANIRDKNITDVFDKIIQTDLRAHIELSHLSVPYLEKTNGTIISISSAGTKIAKQGGLPLGAAYSGVNMMTKVLALELGPKIRVNTVSCGLIETDKQRLNPDKYHQMLEIVEKITPLKRIGQPMDIAKAVVFMASTDAEFITGANLIVDGGLVFTAGGL